MATTIHRLVGAKFTPRRKRTAGVACASAAIALSILDYRGCFGHRGDDYGRYHDKSFRVNRVVDGDTIVVDARDGRRRRTRIRLWGVDAPEIAHDDGPSMFFGTEAADFASDALEGRSVRLELLADSTRDRHGRLLAYVYPSGWQDSLNERLIEQGFGYADWRFPHVYRTRYNEVEARARRRRRGLWASVRPDQTPRWRQRMIARSSRKTKTENSSD